MEEKEGKSIGSYFDGALSFIVRTAGTILSYCGIPGLALILLFYFIEKHASEEQKRLLIDSFLLMKNQNVYFLVFFYTILVAAGTLCIQHFYWKRKDKLQQSKIQDLEKTNSKLQDKLIKLKKQ